MEEEPEDREKGRVILSSSKHGAALVFTLQPLWLPALGRSIVNRVSGGVPRVLSLPTELLATMARDGFGERGNQLCTPWWVNSPGSSG